MKSNKNHSFIREMIGIASKTSFTSDEDFK